MTTGNEQLAEDDLRSRYQRMLPEGVQLTRRLGTGTKFGDLFLAEDSRGGVHKPVERTVRFLPPHDPGSNREAWAGWARQIAKRLSQFVGLQLPHVASPVDVVFRPSGELYIVSPYHEQTLAQLIGTEEHPTPGHAVVILDQLLAGLAAVHVRGIAHGDIRPQNVFVEKIRGQSGPPSVWIGDPVTGLLQIESRNQLEHADHNRYYCSTAVTPAKDELAKADLYALARTACDLRFPKADELFEKCDGSPSAGKLWNVYNGAATKRRLGQVAQGRARGADQVAQRRLTRVIATLLHEPADAAAVASRLQRHAYDRDVAIHRWLIVAAVGAVVLCIAFVAGLARRWQLEAELDESRKDKSRAEAKASMEISGRQSEIDDLRRQLDKKVADERASEPEAPPVPDARSRAKAAWKTAFPTPSNDETIYDKQKAQALYEEWAKKDGEVAGVVKEWKQGPRGDGGLDGLMRLARPWLGAGSDATLKRRCDGAGAEPWEKLDKAWERTDTLRMAAERWEKCAKPAMDAKAVIDIESDLAVKTILSAWYQKLLTTQSWVLQLETGTTALDAGRGKSRKISIYAASTSEGLVHQWRGPGKRFESWYQYENDKSTHGKITFDWRPGDSIRLYVEEDWSIYTFGVRPNLIDREFGGPLAIWKFDQAELVRSDDGNTRVSYRVIGCPGPPRGWNVSRTVAKKLMKEPAEILKGATGK